MNTIGARLQSLAFSGLCAGLLPLIITLVDRLRPDSGFGSMESWPLCAVLTVFAWVTLMLLGRTMMLSVVTSAFGSDPEGIGRNYYETGTLPPSLADYLNLPRPTQVRAAHGDEYLVHTEAAISELDNSAHAWMGPVHALIWALPGIGFLGTAWELRCAIALLFERGSGGPALMEPAGAVPSLNTMGDVLRTSLGNAFGIICLALAATAVAHVLASLISRSEARLAIDLRRWWYVRRAEAQRQAEYIP